MRKVLLSFALLAIAAVSAAVAARTPEPLATPPQDAAARAAIIAGMGDPGAPEGSSNCCVANGGLGCDDPVCETAICNADPFCCDVAWDGLCASAANAICGVCVQGTGDCCSANGGLGCEDTDCTTLVCAVDAFCCAVAWDGLCASEAHDLCAACSIQAIPTASKVGLGVLAAALLLGGGFLLRRRRAA